MSAANSLAKDNIGTCISLLTSSKLEICQCDTNAHTQDHYMREKVFVLSQIRDSTYGMGCTSKGNSPWNMAGT